MCYTCVTHCFYEEYLRPVTPEVAGSSPVGPAIMKPLNACRVQGLFSVPQRFTEGATDSRLARPPATIPSPILLSGSGSPSGSAAAS